MTCVDFFAYVFTVSGLVATLAGIVLVFYIYLKKCNAKIKALAEHVIAYYSEEIVTISQLAELTCVNPVRIQKRLRTEAVSDDNNREGVRPTMTADRARKIRDNA